LLAVLRFDLPAGRRRRRRGGATRTAGWRNPGPPSARNTKAPTRTA